MMEVFEKLWEIGFAVKVLTGTHILLTAAVVVYVLRNSK